MRMGIESGGHHVLAIVDHPALADVFVSHIQASPVVAAVTIIGSRQDTLARVDETAAAVVVVDDQTETDAAELCRFLSSRRPDIPVVLLGTGSIQQVETLAAEALVAAYALKVLSGKTVRETIANVVDGYRWTSEPGSNHPPSQGHGAPSRRL